MALSLGTVTLVHRDHTPAQCKNCSEVIQYEYYYVLRQMRKSGKYFFRYLHLGCFTEYSLKANSRVKKKPSGGQKGVRLNLPEEIRVQHRKWLSRVRYLFRAILIEDRPDRLHDMSEEYEEKIKWLRENSRIKTLGDKMRDENFVKTSTWLNQYMRFGEKQEAARSYRPGALVKEGTSEEGQLAGVYYTPGKRRKKVVEND